MNRSVGHPIQRFWRIQVVLVCVAAFLLSGTGVWGAAPTNDAFAGARLIEGDKGTLKDLNVGASKEAGEPDHGGNSGGASVWYRWTAPFSGSATFDTFRSTFDTLLGAYVGASVTSLSEVAGNDDFDEFTFQSQIRFSAQVGVTYAIAVDGFGGDSGTIFLNWQLIVPPPNDNFANATTLVGSAGSVRGSNVNAGKELGEPDPFGNPGGASVWYRWTAPTTGTATVDTIGSNFDTILGIYTGATLGSLTELAADDDAGGNLSSLVRFSITEGAVYHIVVDGYFGQVGDFFLDWAPVACTIMGDQGVNRLTGTPGPDVFCALGGDDFINGGDGSDTMLGGEGHDTLRGSDGNDTLIGGAGKDNAAGGPGDDGIDGGPGIDTVTYLNSPLKVGVDLFTGTAEGQGSDTLTSIERVVGSSFNDRVRGSREHDVLLGMGGVDTLIGGLDNDDLSGGTGDDELEGGSGNDDLNGGPGDDDIDGGSGDDELGGGLGDDNLNGGPGSDVCDQGAGTGSQKSCESD